MIRFGVPVAVIVLLLIFFYSRIPDRSIPGYVDHQLIEANYGREMDAALATLENSNLDEVRQNDNVLLICLAKTRRLSGLGSWTNG